MYTEIFEGLRSYYARYPSRRSAAGFHAAMTLSFLFCVAITAAVTLADYFINGNILWSVELFGNKLALIATGIAVAYAHIQFGKRTGRYNSVELLSPSHWQIYFAIYAGTAAILLLSAVLVALVM